MSNFAYDPPPSPPPPSYEISQNEFDQKTSHVLEQSAAEPPPRRVDKEGFEIWDEAIYEAHAALNTLSLGQSLQFPRSIGNGEAAAQAHSRHPSSSSSSIPLPPAFSPSPRYGSRYPPEKSRALPELVAASSSSSGSRSSADVGLSSPPLSPPQTVRPLRVNKRTRPTKERPAWYADAGLGGGSPPPSPLQSSAGSSSTPEERPLRRQLTVFNSTEREGTPPPEFTPVGPSLDGPPYDAIVMTYEGEPPPPPSPPSGTPGPPAFSTHPPPIEYMTPQPQVAPLPTDSTIPQLQVPHAPVPRAGSVRPHPAHAQSLPEPQAHHTPSPRPHPVHHQSVPVARPPPASSVSAIRGGAALRASAYEPTAPRLSFNPQMAYAKPAVPTMATYIVDTEPVVSASAFYSNAVSSHYAFTVPAHMRRPTDHVQ
ncbi:hypothetical protein C8Q74DRAFT_823054 [Fomes fomentarius]|nr:hypothetical protein C8Q74DRAFT_823054 [Fomes fomentarius]